MPITVTRVRRTDRGRMRVVGRSRRRVIKSTVPRNKFGFKTQHFFKIKTESGVVSDASGNITYDLALRDPSAGINWGDLASLFDSYRVLYYKIQYNPMAPNDIYTSRPFPMLYTYWDTDNAAGVTPTQTISLGHSNMIPKQLHRGWKRFVRVPRFTGTTPNDVGWLDTANPEARGRFYLYADGAQASSVYGNLLITWYVGTRMNI